MAAKSGTFRRIKEVRKLTEEFDEIIEEEEVRGGFQVEDRILTDVEFAAGGRKRAVGLERAILSYQPWRLGNNRMDFWLNNEEAVRRYTARLCIIVRGKAVATIDCVSAGKSKLYRRIAKSWNDELAWPTRLNHWEQRIKEEFEEKSEAYRQSVEERLAGLERRHAELERQLDDEKLRVKAGVQMVPIERDIEDLKREIQAVAEPKIRKVRGGKQRDETRNDDLRLERRWYLDVNQSSKYQQYSRTIYGRVPDDLFFRMYNYLRRKQQADPNWLVEDPFSGRRMDVLDDDIKRANNATRIAPETRRLMGKVRIGRLNEFGLATLAEYIIARLGKDYRTGYKWLRRLRAEAVQRGFQGDEIDDYCERRTFWITPSCSQEYTKALARNSRNDLLPNLSEEQRRGSLKDTKFIDLVNENMDRARDFEEEADNLAENTDAASYVMSGFRIENGRVIPGSANVKMPSVEELRDLTRDNEDEIATRTNTQAYDAGLMSDNRVGNARDRGIGGRRSAVPWWWNPKFRLLWCLHHRLARNADGSIRRNKRGNPDWELRFNAEELALVDAKAHQAFDKGEITVEDRDKLDFEAKAKAWERRMRPILFGAMNVDDPMSDERPADTASSASVLDRKASITRGEELNIIASTKALNGAGYDLKNGLNKDLPGARNYPPVFPPPPGEPDGEDYVLQLEIMYFIDPRYIYKHHKGAWSWMLVQSRNQRTRRIDRRIVATRETFLRQQDFLRAQYQLQPVGPMLMQMEHAISSAERNREMDTLKPIKDVYDYMPDQSHFETATQRPDGTWDLEPFRLPGDDRALEGREDFEGVIERYRARALDWYENFVADETFVNWARNYKDFHGSAAAGRYARVGDEELSKTSWAADQAEFWYSFVHDELTKEANMREADGVLWTGQDRLEWRKKMLQTMMGMWYVNGQMPQREGPVWSVRHNHVMVWLIKRCGFPNLTPAEVREGRGITFEAATKLMDGEPWERIEAWLNHIGMGNDWVYNRVRSIWVGLRGLSAAA